MVSKFPDETLRMRRRNLNLCICACSKTNFCLARPIWRNHHPFTLCWRELDTPGAVSASVFKGDKFYSVFVPVSSISGTRALTALVVFECRLIRHRALMHLIWIWTVGQCLSPGFTDNLLYTALGRHSDKNSTAINNHYLDFVQTRGLISLVSGNHGDNNLNGSLIYVYFVSIVNNWPKIDTSKKGSARKEKNAPNWSAFFTV